jgi:hypothetical protein
MDLSQTGAGWGPAKTGEGEHQCRQPSAYQDNHVEQCLRYKALMVGTGISGPYRSPTTTKIRQEIGH